MAINESENRIEWMDSLKGMGIVFVVAGHTLWPNVQHLIYMFHMPLFFLISGYLFKRKDTKTLIKQKLTSLMLPYLAYLIIFTAFEFKNLYFNSLHTSENIVLLIKNMIYGGQRLRGTLGVFWFVTVLFFSQIVFTALLNSFSERALGFIVFALYVASFALPFDEYTSPLDIYVIFNALPYIHAGYIIKKHNINISSCISLILSALYFIAGIYFSKYFAIDMKSSTYGMPFLSMIGCVSVFSFLIHISKTIPDIKLLKDLGMASMTIMFTHQFVNIYLARSIFNNQAYIFMFCIAQSFMLHFLISKYRTTNLVLCGVRR